MAQKILIVDDNPNALRLIGYALHREGYEIVVAQSGPEALEKVGAERPDLVILDIMMPEMNGYEVCRRLRNTPQTARIPIILLTAKAQVDDKVEGFAAGADDYLTKPVLPVELIARVKALLLRAGYTPPTPPRQARIVSFIGSKGGVGTTSLAVNVAVLLAQKEKTVILADLQPYIGAVSLQLGLHMRNSLATLLAKPACDVNESAVKSCLLSHRSGLQVLPAAPGLSEGNTDISTEHMSAILNQLSGMADNFILDLGANINPAVQLALQRSNRIILVTEPDQIALDLAKNAINSICDLGVGGSTLSVVMVNRTRSGSTYLKTEIEEMLGSTLLTVITPAPEMFFRANKEGMPVAIAQPDTLTADQLKELAKLVVE